MPAQTTLILAFGERDAARAWADEERTRLREEEGRRRVQALLLDPDDDGTLRQLQRLLRDAGRMGELSWSIGGPALDALADEANGDAGQVLAEATLLPDAQVRLSDLFRNLPPMPEEAPDVVGSPKLDAAFQAWLTRRQARADATEGFYFAEDGTIWAALRSPLEQDEDLPTAARGTHAWAMVEPARGTVVGHLVRVSGNDDFEGSWVSNDQQAWRLPHSGWPSIFDLRNRKLEDPVLPQGPEAWLKWEDKPLSNTEPAAAPEPDEDSGVVGGTWYTVSLREKSEQKPVGWMWVGPPSNREQRLYGTPELLAGDGENFRLPALAADGSTSWRFEQQTEGPEPAALEGMAWSRVALA